MTEKEVIFYTVFYLPKINRKLKRRQINNIALATLENGHLDATNFVCLEMNARA